MTKINLKNTKIPNRIVIGGVEYMVHLTPGLRNDKDVQMLGNIDYENCEIVISSEYNQQTIWVALIHEIIHGICTAHDLELDEGTLDSLAYGLFGCIVLTDWEKPNDSDSYTSV